MSSAKDLQTTVEKKIAYHATRPRFLAQSAGLVTAPEKFYLGYAAKPIKPSKQQSTQ